MSENLNFYQGSKENYNPSEMQGGLYFSKDSKEILLNGDSYGNATPADEEDITAESGNLKLRDRAYDEASFSGKGYKILRKNITEGKNVLTLDMINDPNTIYEIRYDFDLNGEEITIPEGCILDFQGGSFSNGIVNLNDNKIYSNHKCFNINLNLKDNYIYINTVWFGLNPNNTSDENRDIFNHIFHQGDNNGQLIVYIPKGEYKTNGVTMIDSKYIHLFGDGVNKTYIRLDETDSKSLFLFDLKISNSYIHDISFRGNIYNWSKGLVFNNTNINIIALLNISGFSNTIYNTNILGSPNHGIYINSSNNIKLINCSLLYNWGYAAFNMFVRGIVYENCWCELNYMGGIIHFRPYSNNSFNSSDCILVKGSITENNGVYGIKGNYKNYKGENIENIGAYITLCNTLGDIIKTESSYNGTNTNLQVLVKPCKRKYYTLTSDGTLSFKDNSFNDFIIYKRNNVFNITFEKKFIVGDTIYIYDFQQDCNITNNSISWIYETYSKVNYNSLNYIELSGLYQRLLIEKDSFYNLNVIGNNISFIDNRDKKFNYFNHYIEQGIGKIVYNTCSTRGTLPNIMSPNIIEDEHTIINPNVVVSSLDTGILYCYMIVNYNSNVSIILYKRINNELITEHSEYIKLNGFTVIEYIIDNTDGNIQNIQWHISGVNKLKGYYAIVSNVRFPYINNSVRQNTTTNRPLLNANNKGFQYFDTTLNKPIWWNGTEWVTSDGLEADSTGWALIE